MSASSSRRRPFPFHMRMGGATSSLADRVGLMLVASEQGILVGRKQTPLDNVVPTEQIYASAPIYRERTFAARPTGGYGERVQASLMDRRYYWGKNIQVSGGLFGKGPLVHGVQPTPAPGGPCLVFIDHNSEQIVLSGTKVYRRVDDSEAGQVVLHDFAPYTAWDAVVFQGGFAGATPNLYVTSSSGELWERTPANVWTMCAMPANFNAKRLEVVGTELWAADRERCVIRKVTADPKVAGNWSGPFFVGNPNTPITALRQSGNQLVIFKEDGSLFTLGSDGSCYDLFPGLRVPRSMDNGWRANAWMGALWFRAGPSFYRLDMPEANLNAVGPGKFLDNASPVRGESRAFVGWGGYQAYLGLWNPATNTSYLLSYGSWEPGSESTPDAPQYVFNDQFDGSLAEWPSRKITGMGVSGATGQDRLYIGFDDGGWDWFKLTQNPLAADSGAEFALGPSELVLPLHTALFQADLKQWVAFSLFGPVMRPGDEAVLSYRIMATAGGPPTDPVGDWITLGTFRHNGERIEAPPALAGGGLQVKVGLVNSTEAATPVLETIAIHERVVPAFKRDFSGTIDARNYVTRMDGAVMRSSATRIHSLVMQAAAAPSTMILELPDETLSELAIFNYQEKTLPRQAGGGIGWGIQFEATQFKVLTVYGIIRRLRGTRIRDLRGYAISTLRFL